MACFEVFQTWEDEYEKLQVLLRDIVKRKREENLKMVWRLSPAHRKLQSRLDHMRRFRRQHEQLRAVIVRVLRPQVIMLKYKQRALTCMMTTIKIQSRANLPYQDYLKPVNKKTEILNTQIKRFILVNKIIQL